MYSTGDSTGEFRLTAGYYGFNGLLDFANRVAFRVGESQIFSCIWVMRARMTGARAEIG